MSDPKARVLLCYYFAGHGVVDKNGVLEVILDKDKRFKPTERMKSITLNGPRVTTLGVYDCCRVGNLE